jgi:NAD(P)-dependent dehydrogenase (short-subunit alcohol dehydrogenase family)
MAMFPLHASVREILNVGFSDKVVVVTGGAKGIGRAAGLSFSRLGAGVVIVDVNEGAGISVQAEITEMGGNCIFVGADISIDSAVERVRDAAMNAFGRIDVLVNNAAIPHSGTVVDDSPEAWDRVIAVNLRAAYLCSHFIVPELLKHPGASIINVGSVQSLVASPRSAAYVVCKFGLLGLTKAMAVDHAPNIRVNAVLPGSVDTGMFRNGFASETNYASRLPAIEGKYPLRRIGRAEEVADMIVFLASDAASFITGAAFLVDGGLTAMA